MARARAAVTWPADQVERWAIEKLIPYARNTRTHSEAQIAQLAAAIREWGWTMPVLVDEAGTIIAGHGRVMAARQLEIAEVPVIVARGWSEAKRRAYAIADNQLALQAGWDLDMLKVEFADLQEAGVDLAMIGFGPAEIEAVFTGGVERMQRLPPLPNGDRNPFQEMTFILHDDQVELVKEALRAAKEQGPFEGPNENSNGNALARICEDFSA